MLDEIVSLNSQCEELDSAINHLAHSEDIKSQQELDDLVAQIKVGFATAERGLDVHP